MKIQEGDQEAEMVVVPAEQETSNDGTSEKVSKGGKKVGGGEGGGLRKGPWTPAEDKVLIEHVQMHGEGSWNKVQRLSGLKRCGKSCRLRWANHLRPNLKKGSFSPEEEELILRLHAQLGNKWARMATQLPGRTDNEIKNFWNTRLKRRQRVGLSIYPPKIQETIKSDGGNQPQQHLMAASSGVPPLPPTRRWPELNPLQQPTPFAPANPCPPSRITLPPIPWSPFPCHLDFGFSLTSISPPTTPTPLLQKHQIGTQSYGVAPLVPPPAPFKMELPSFQMFPDSGGGGIGADVGCSSGSNSCMLMDALLKDAQVVDHVYIGELLAPPEVDQQIAGWEELVCGGDLVGGNDNESKLPATKIGGMDCGTRIVIAGDTMSNAGITENINIPALLDMPAPVIPTITDWYNIVDRRLTTTTTTTMMTTNVEQSSAMANGDLGFELQQLASSLSHDLPTEQEWSMNTLSPWDMSRIC